MITSLGPAVCPAQFAVIRTPTARTATPVFYKLTYITRQVLDAAGWAQRDPVFFEMCNGARPQGAYEICWLLAHVLRNTPNPRMPRIPRNQVRYLPARVYATLVGALASKLDAIRAVFREAEVGNAIGLGLTAYGPETLPFQLALTDHRGRREHYTVGMLVHPTSTLSQFVRGNPHALLGQQIALFSNGGVELHFAHIPLAPSGGRASTRPRNFDMLLPLDPLRVVLRQQQHTSHANGRLAALLP